MDSAIMVSPGLARTREISAASFEKQLYRSPGLKDRVTLFSPRNLLPVIFRAGKKVEGDSVTIRPHFAYAAGYGFHDHVLKREQQDSIDEQIRKGKLVVLSLNFPFTADALDFRGMKDPNTFNVEEWLDRNYGQYVSLSVRSAAEAVKAIQKVKELSPHPNLNRVIFPLYRGAVVPYDYFYLNDNAFSLTCAFDAVAKLETAVPLGATRAVGFPRLFRFVPSRTNLSREEPPLKLKGNGIHREGPPGTEVVFYNELFFEDEGIRRQPAYRELWDKIKGNPGQIFVMACPSVTINPDAPVHACRSGAGRRDKIWQQFRWTLRDIEAQTVPSSRAHITTAAQAPAPYRP